MMFTRSRLNLEPEKLHSDGKANKLCGEAPAMSESKVSKTMNKLHSSCHRRKCYSLCRL